MHSKMRTANLCATCVSNQTLRRASVIRPHVKSGRDGKGMESKKRNKTEESADLSDICIQLGLHVRFFFFFFSLSQQDGRRGGGRGGGGGDRSAYQNERLQQFPYYSYCNHFNPSPVCVPGCVDTAKRRDASYCMTN